MCLIQNQWLILLIEALSPSDEGELDGVSIKQLVGMFLLWTQMEAVLKLLPQGGFQTKGRGSKMVALVDDVQHRPPAGVENETARVSTKR